jgi:hypothetical protein
VQPVALAANIHAGLIGMHEVSPGKCVLRPLPEGAQSCIGFLVEVEERADAYRNLHLILEIIPDAIIGGSAETGTCRQRWLSDRGRIVPVDSRHQERR